MSVLKVFHLQSLQRKYQTIAYCKVIVVTYGLSPQDMHTTRLACSKKILFLTNSFTVISNMLYSLLPYTLCLYCYGGTVSFCDELNSISDTLIQSQFLLNSFIRFAFIRALLLN